jgi:hypothetical protein
VTSSATRIPATTSAAPTRKATWKPPVSACRVDSPAAARLSVRDDDTVASTASPSAAPICVVVLTSPDASPASSGVAPDMATVISAGMAIPAPRPSSAALGRMCCT